MGLGSSGSPDLDPPVDPPARITFRSMDVVPSRCRRSMTQMADRTNR